MKAFLIEIPVGAHHVQAAEAGTRHPSSTCPFGLHRSAEAGANI
jgi:hypothetical protein